MKYVIVGAGVAGLSAAYKLLENGHEVIVLEKESKIGGLSKSFYYGNFIFDIGPHRFFTDKKEIYQFIRFVLKPDYAVIDRISSVHLLNKYYSWPLKLGAFMKLPLSILLKVSLDLFFKPKYEGHDFKSAIISSYGKTLYNLIFKDYTKKFCCILCEELHRDWMKAALDKAIIDKRIKIDSLLDLIKMIRNSMSFRMKFLYSKGGCGRFAQNLGQMISEKGGRIVTDIDDISINFKDYKITSLIYNGQGSETIEFDYLIYTAPITQLTQQLNLGVPNLEYLNSIVYNIEINRQLNNSYQWVYFGDSDLIFARISFPRNFDRNNVPSGSDSLCAEVTCKKDSLLWNNPESIKEQLIDDLIKIKLCQRKDIDGIHIEKIANTYPLYKLNYLQELENTKSKLSKFHNLTCLGRTGLFWYNNMDESIKMALEIADNIGAG